MMKIRGFSACLANLGLAMNLTTLCVAQVSPNQRAKRVSPRGGLAT